MSVYRRNFLLGSAALAAAAATGSGAQAARRTRRQRRPNIVLYHSDQFRWDFIGANGLNGCTRTPNLDALAAQGTNFPLTVSNQPVCGPSRACLMTGCYATNTGVWRNGLLLRPDLPTLAGELRKAGYSANYIGKWHLSLSPANGGVVGPVKPAERGGFLDFWEGANALEHTSHPYEGEIYDGDGKAIRFKDEYRVDFLTRRAERFLRQKHQKPFFLMISQLEPHQQNDLHRMVGPKGSREQFANPFVPPDLRPFPGDWYEQLPDYYGSCARIDASVGRIRQVLAEEGFADDTIFVFTSDHGCHFMTRNEEYKRSPHNSSLRIPFLMCGPGIDAGRRMDELVSVVHIAPTLLDIAGARPPSTMQGRSVLPLLREARARAAWPNRELIQISESMTGRAIRTRDWLYCVAVPEEMPIRSSSPVYDEYQMYDQRNDPYEQVNLAGRKEFRDVAADLRAQLVEMMTAAGEAPPTIRLAGLYP